MPRSPTTNREIRDARREDILRAATKLFARRGFTDTKVNDIAEDAGLSHGLVYHYFPSKEAIFEEILAARRKQAWARIDETEAETGAEGALRMLLELTLSDAVERPEITLMITQALISDAIPERVRASIRRGAREGFERAVRVIEQGQARGEVDRGVPAEELASAIFCLIRGVVMTSAIHHRGGGPVPVPKVDTILRLLEPSTHERASARKQTPPERSPEKAPKSAGRARARTATRKT